MEILFQVQGSAADPYSVVFRRDEVGLSASCNCPAGDNGQACKHRLSILRGDATNIISDNAKQMKMLLSWLAGTNVEAAMNAVERAEHQFEEAKAAVAKAKKALGVAMRGRIDE